MTGEAACSLARRAVSILVVEDDEDNRDALVEVLSEEGYSVVCARDGAEALAVLRCLRPEIILLDLNMPTMNGLEFRRAQARDPSLAPIPTVVVTAVQGLREWTRELAPAETVSKPVTLAQLLSVVRRHAQAT